MICNRQEKTHTHRTRVVFKYLYKIRFETNKKIDQEEQKINACIQQTKQSNKRQKINVKHNININNRRSNIHDQLQFYVFLKKLTI